MQCKSPPSVSLIFRPEAKSSRHSQSFRSIPYKCPAPPTLIPANAFTATLTPFPCLDAQGLQLDSLGGQSPARKELQQLVQTLQNGQPAPFSSYLLEGNTGSGKTTLVRALAGELAPLGITTLHAEAADFTENGPQKLKQLFAEAQQAAARSPLKTCVVLLDEVDGMARIRSNLPDQDLQVGVNLSGALSGPVGWVGVNQLTPAPEKTPSNTEQHQLLTTLTSQMDKNINLILIGATSRSDTMDKEARDRFQRSLECPTPSGPEERLSLLQAIAKRKNLQIEAEVLQDMAAASRGDNPGALDKGLRLAQVLGDGKVTAESAREARLQTAFGTARPITNPDWMLRLTICHEMGHVVVRHLFEEMAAEHPDQLPKGIDAVSFAPRGVANAAVFLKSTTNPASTFEWYMAEIASNLAGRTSEALFGQGHLSAGPGSDINYATTLVKEAVREKGMGKTLGPVNARSDSEQARASQDEENILKVSDQIATSTVEFYRDFTESFAQDLVTRRNDLKSLTLSGRDLQNQLRAWVQADPQRAQRLAQLKADIHQAVEAIKPTTSPGLAGH